MTILFLSVAFFTPAIALFAKVIRITYIGLSVLLVLMTTECNREDFPNLLVGLRYRRVGYQDDQFK